MKKIEKIQKQALRYIFNDFNASYSELLEKGNRPLMYTHRLRRILSFVGKCIEGKSVLKGKVYCWAVLYI